MYTMIMPVARSLTRSMMDLANPIFNEMRSFSVDIRKTDRGWELMADLPGVKKEDIEISLEQDQLKISASFGEEKKEGENGYTRVERSYGSFTRSFSVPDVDQEAITAAFADGVLTLDLPQIREEKPEVRRIAISGSDA